jgi:acetyl-CoA carboxylase carboxyltransferase component
MVGGSLHEPVLTVAWPGAHLGPMGLEGAVRLGLRKELDTIADQGEGEERVRQATAADTRGLIAATLTAAASAEPQRSRRRFVDIW